MCFYDEIPATTFNGQIGRLVLFDVPTAEEFRHISCNQPLEFVVFDANPTWHPSSPRLGIVTPIVSPMSIDEQYDGLIFNAPAAAMSGDGYLPSPSPSPTSWSDIFPSPAYTPLSDNEDDTLMVDDDGRMEDDADDFFPLPGIPSPFTPPVVDQTTSGTEENPIVIEDEEA